MTDTATQVQPDTGSPGSLVGAPTLTASAKPVHLLFALAGVLMSSLVAALGMFTDLASTGAISAGVGGVVVSAGLGAFTHLGLKRADLIAASSWASNKVLLASKSLPSIESLYSQYEPSIGVAVGLGDDVLKQLAPGIEHEVRRVVSGAVGDLSKVEHFVNTHLNPRTGALDLSQYFKEALDAHLPSLVAAVAAGVQTHQAGSGPGQPTTQSGGPDLMSQPGVAQAPVPDPTTQGGQVTGPPAAPTPDALTPEQVAAGGPSPLTAPDGSVVQGQPADVQAQPQPAQAVPVQPVAPGLAQAIQPQPAQAGSLAPVPPLTGVPQS